MRNTLFALVLAFFANAAYAGLSKAKICYTDLTFGCFVVVYDAETLATVTIIAPSTATITPERQAKFLEYGIVVHYSKPQQWKLSAKDAPTINTTFANEVGIMGDIPDEQWNAWYSGTGCIGAAIACGGGVFSTYVSGGLTYWLSQAVCVGTGAICADAVRNIEKWSAAQKKLARESRERNKLPTPSIGGGGGASSGGQGSSPISGGSSGIPDDGIPCPACTITGSGGTIEDPTKPRKPNTD